MKRGILICVFFYFITILLLADEWQSINKYKKKHKEGYCNMIFATRSIGKGKEAAHQLKTTFTKPDKVYARCYFPGEVGIVTGKNFWHEIWIDGKYVMRTYFEEPPGADWDQIQIWVTEDEYKNQMQGLTRGEHTIILWVIRNEYRGKKWVTEKNSAGNYIKKEKEIWVPIRLSKGKFTYIVP